MQKSNNNIKMLFLKKLTMQYSSTVHLQRYKTLKSEDLHSCAPFLFRKISNFITDVGHTNISSLVVMHTCM